MCFPMIPSRSLFVVNTFDVFLITVAAKFVITAK